MLKKFALASAILVSTVGVAMASAPAPYVGAGLGITANTASDSNAPGYRGAPVNLFAGYGGVINQNFYLAGEVSATPGTFQVSSKNSTLKTTYGYGASILPGLMLNDRTLAFARAGVVKTRFTNPGTSETGAEFGLGLQTSVTQNVDIRGEYDYTAYRSFSGLSPRSDAATISAIYKFE